MITMVEIKKYFIYKAGYFDEILGHNGGKQGFMKGDH
jgi:hypothetical protein